MKFTKKLNQQFVQELNRHTLTTIFLKECKLVNDYKSVYELAKYYVTQYEKTGSEEVVPKTPKHKWDMKQYLRDKNNQKCGFLCAKKVNNEVKIYYSFCDTRYDKFEKDYEPKELRNDINVPYEQVENIKYFLQRAYRYYSNDKTVKIPKWIVEISV